MGRALRFSTVATAARQVYQGNEPYQGIEQSRTDISLQMPNNTERITRGPIVLSERPGMGRGSRKLVMELALHVSGREPLLVRFRIADRAVNFHAPAAPPKM